MIQVMANMYVKQECLEDFLAAVKPLVEKTNELDFGCIKYELCRDKADPLHFVMVEAWESQAAIDNHMQAAHFIELAPKAGEFMSKPPELTILEKVF